jgi:hypothetical protein
VIATEFLFDQSKTSEVSTTDVENGELQIALNGAPRNQLAVPVVTAQEGVS